MINSDSESSAEEEDLEILEFDEQIEFNSHRIIPADHVQESSTIELAKETFCNVCKKDFKRLDNHNTTTHDGGKHKCTQCDGLFVKDLIFRRLVKNYYYIFIRL